MEDIANKAPEEALELAKTSQFLREHLQVSELEDETLLVLYNYAYCQFKYLNQKQVLSESQMKMSKMVKEDLWGFVMSRVTSDKNNKRDYMVIKDRFAEIVRSSVGFEPM